MLSHTTPTHTLPTQNVSGHNIANQTISSAIPLDKMIPDQASPSHEPKISTSMYETNPARPIELPTSPQSMSMYGKLPNVVKGEEIHAPQFEGLLSPSTQETALLTAESLMSPAEGDWLSLHRDLGSPDQGALENYVDTQNQKYVDTLNQNQPNPNQPETSDLCHEQESQPDNGSTVESGACAAQSDPMQYTSMYAQEYMPSLKKLELVDSDCDIDSLDGEKGEETGSKV